jgi:CRP-like cAMP-binding protein
VTPEKMDSETVTRAVEILSIADDLSGMTLRYQEPVPPKPPRRARRKRRVGVSYVMVDTVSLTELETTISERRVLDCLLAHVDVGTNDIRLTTSLIATKTGMQVPNVSRALRSLRDRRLIFKLNVGLWRVSPWLAYAGEWKEWDKAAMDAAEPQWKRGTDDD